MTRREFQAEFRHHVAGIVYDAMYGPTRDGAALSMFLKQVMVKVDNVLGDAYDRIAPVEPVRPAAGAGPGVPNKQRPTEGK